MNERIFPTPVVDLLPKLENEEQKEVIPKDGIIDLESSKLPEEIKQQVTDKGLDILRTTFSHLDGYVIFASTGKYLHGKAKGIEELRKAPGDFDIAVFDDQTLDEIRRRFADVPEVQFLNVEQTADERKAEKNYLTHEDVLSGRQVVFKPFTNEQTRALKGRIVIKVDEKISKYKLGIKFEIFSRTNVVDPRLQRYSETVLGLNTLSMEGLKKQYIRSESKETHVAKNRDAVRTLLDEEKIRLLFASDEPLTDEARTIMEKISLTREDILAYYRLSKELSAIPEQETDAREKKEIEISKLLSGFKTKIESRQASIQALTNAERLVIQSPPVSSSSTTPEQSSPAI